MPRAATSVTTSSFVWTHEGGFCQRTKTGGRRRVQRERDGEQNPAERKQKKQAKRSTAQSRHLSFPGFPGTTGMRRQEHRELAFALRKASQGGKQKKTEKNRKEGRPKERNDSSRLVSHLSLPKLVEVNRTSLLVHSSVNDAAHGPGLLQELMQIRTTWGKVTERATRKDNLNAKDRRDSTGVHGLATAISGKHLRQLIARLPV